MSRKTKLRAQQRQAAARAQQTAPAGDETEGVEVETDELDTTVELEGDGAETDLTEDPAGETDDGEEPEQSATDEEDPYEALKRQFEEAQARSKADLAEAEKRFLAAQANQAAIEQRERALAAEKAAYEERLRAQETRTQELEGQVADRDTQALHSHKAIIEHAIAAENATAENAERLYAEAMAAQDFAAAAKAQRALAAAEAKIYRYQESHEAILEKIETAKSTPPVRKEAPAPKAEPAAPGYQQPHQSVDPFEAEISRFPARDQQWLRAHKDDLANNPARQRLAGAGHTLATDKHGLAPQSDEYYAFMDEHMGYAQPKAADPEPTPAPKPAPKKAPIPGAPVSRSANGVGGSAPQHITPEIRELARDLGMTPAKYMEYMQGLKEGKYPGYRLFPTK